MRIQALLISGTVLSGSGSPLLAGFRWLSVPQQVLNAGSYIIAATSSGDPASFDPFIFEGFDPVVSAGFSLGTASLAQAGSGFIVALPTNIENLPYGFIGPNFASQPVPGPLPVLGGRWRPGLESPLALSPEGPAAMRTAVFYP